MIKQLLVTLVLFLPMFKSSQAQSDNESPVEHMKYLTDREDLLSKKYLSYMSEVAHGERVRKMEKRRTELINSIKEVMKEGNRLRPFKGDASLRNAYLEYWSVLLSVFTEDYGKIVDMEEVAEQSYDMMEAYLLVQEKADRKLDEANDKVPVAFNAFAAAHNVRLTESQGSKLDRKLNQAGLVNAYVNKIYLIYFKSTIQEEMAIKALNKNDMNGLEQNRGSVLKYVEEGFAKLDTLKPFNGDGSMITACRKVLEFQKVEADKKIPVLSDFLMKKEAFDKIQKTYEAKPAAKRTQADVDGYNKTVNEINAASATYNKVNDELNTGRTKVFNNWSITRKHFMDIHIPYK